MKKKVISFVIASLTILGYVVYTKQQAKEDCLSGRKHYSEIEYCGVIIKKFEDKQNHSLNVLQIKEQDDTTYFRTHKDNCSLFQYAKTGDSIKKESGTLKVKIRRNNKDSVKMLRFKCP